MQNVSLGTIEYWFRTRLVVEGSVKIRKKRKNKIRNLEIKDSLVMNSDDSTSVDALIPKNSLKNVSKNQISELKPDLFKSKNNETLNPIKAEHPFIITCKKQSEKAASFETFLEKKLPDSSKANESCSKDGKTSVFKEKKIEYCFECPENTCNKKFVNSEDLVQHITGFHSLSCKMPYCVFSCYNFKEYFAHFESVHCLISVPKKRPSEGTFDAGPKIKNKSL